MTFCARVTGLCCAALVAVGLVVGPYAAAPASAAELIADGSFESATGSPLNSPSWTEADSDRTSPLCSTSLCPTSASVSPPRTGDKWIVFGARNSSTQTASMSQAVTIPSGGTATLTYWYRSAEVSSPFTATVTVKVDGTTLKTHTETATAESAYSQQTVNLNTYANGASHTISFNYSANGSSSSQRLVIDDVSLSYTAPVTTGTPTVSSTSPASPSSSTTPVVKGTAETGSTVTLYSNSTCTSSALGTGSAATFAGAGITATVPANATTTIWAKATKSGQTASACSSTSVAYTNDSTAPGLVTVSTVTPASPSTDTSPELQGTAEAGSTVKVYSTAGCTGSPLVSGTAAAFASPGLTVPVTIGTTVTLRATATDAAGNTSACSTSSKTYTADLKDGGFEGATGSPANSPDWAESDSLAGTPLCTTATCTPGSEIAPRTGQAWAWFGGFADAGHTGSLSQAVLLPSSGPVALTFWYRNSGVSAPYDAQLLVQVDGVTVRTIIEASAAATSYTQQVVDLSAFADGGGHIVTFSYANGAEGVNNMLVDDVGLRALAGTHVATPTVTATAPASPSTTAAPLVTGTAEAGSTVRLYGDAACRGASLGTGAAADFATTGIAASVPSGATTTIYAKAIKAGKDDSACSTSHATYTRLGPPDTSLTKKPKKVLRTRHHKDKVTFAFVSPVAGASFECRIDEKAFTPCRSPQKYKVKQGKHTFAVRAVAYGLTDPTPATWRFKIKRR